MFKEHDIVILTKTIPDEALEAGDVGTIIHIHRRGEAFEVEFQSLDGRTIAIATVLAGQIRPVSTTDISHARQIALMR